jgi:phospholipid-translocating ATPase
MYHEETDTPCLPRTWNISDDLGQIEYVFSDKTGTLTQNVMEYRKCTINGVAYGLGETEATYGAHKRDGQDDKDSAPPTQDLDEQKRLMYELQANLFKNPYLSDNPTFIDPKVYKDISNDGEQRTAMIHFFSTLALCHTAIAERPTGDDIDDKKAANTIEYKAQSPDEAALVATARDLGFTFLGREADLLSVNIMGEVKAFDLLNVLEFNSTRKRMSVIIRPKDGSNRIVLLCKGADSVIFERLCTDFGDQHDLATKQQQLRDDTEAHLETFATEGLRTLCLAYRFIAADDYNEWNKAFLKASSSIYGREEKLDQVCEEIESNLLLMGGTAIEDRLQDGVPETIAMLAQSGIKLWVLTGDKTETAINIGYACNLITTDMELLVVRATTREDTIKQMEDALALIKKEAEMDKDGVGYDGDERQQQQTTAAGCEARRRSFARHEEDPPAAATTNEQHQTPTTFRRRALVIDGVTLKYALEPSNKHFLLRLGMECASVICCRVSPKQKAQVVALVKRGLDVMTLAIGDGANDVSMIQEANVGVGISGVEGRQAVMSSDYAIAQFRFLQKLLLVHGRWSYLRTAEMIMGFFFKNIVWTFVLFWYQIFCQ